MALRNLGVSIRPEFLFGERVRVVAMGVQGEQQRRAFLHDADSGMTASVDATLVALR